jgi:signal transduction histidine kinase
VTRFGAWDVDEADPVRIQISEPKDDPSNVLVSITDRGLGVPADHFRGMFFWFWSSNKPIM